MRRKNSLPGIPFARLPLDASARTRGTRACIYPARRATHGRMPASTASRLLLWILVLVGISAPSYGRQPDPPVRGRATARVVHVAPMQPDVTKILQRDPAPVAPLRGDLSADVITRELRAPNDHAPAVILVEAQYQ